MVKTTTKRKRKKSKKKQKKKNRTLLIAVIVWTLLTLAAVAFVFRFAIIREAQKIYIKANHITFNTPSSESVRIDRIFKRFDKHLFGVDFSHYQGIINWNHVDTFNCGKPVSFVIVRATMGHNGKDIYFNYNWKNLKKKKLIKGAYHYYRPNENSAKQAANFIKRVKLEKGDLPPILDIEAVPTVQSVKNLRIGLKRWLNIIEDHYGVKPIIYSSDHYFKTYLSKKEFRDYTLWIANFNNMRHPKENKWLIWQFTEKGTINGVDGFVDFNVFRGSKKDLNVILIK